MSSSRAAGWRPRDVGYVVIEAVQMLSCVTSVQSHLTNAVVYYTYLPRNGHFFTTMDGICGFIQPM